MEYILKILIFYSFISKNIIVAKMFSNNYDNVYPKKVYCCSCLMHLVNQIYSANIRCSTEILQAINKLCQGSSSRIYCLRMEEKTRCIVLCQALFIITMMSEMNYECTFQTEKDYYFDCLQNRFCVSCVRHYCKNMCSIYPFMVLISKSFVFF